MLGTGPRFHGLPILPWHRFRSVFTRECALSVTCYKRFLTGLLCLVGKNTGLFLQVLSQFINKFFKIPNYGKCMYMAICWAPEACVPVAHMFCWILHRPCVSQPCMHVQHLIVLHPRPAISTTKASCFSHHRHLQKAGNEHYMYKCKVMHRWR